MTSIFSKSLFRSKSSSTKYHYKIKIIIELYKNSYEETSAYYNDISNLTWGDKYNYDSLIDSSIGINEIVDLIYAYINN